MKVKLGELVEDFDLYPRVSVDSGHVSQVLEAVEAEVTLPDIIIDRKTKRIVDGFHRRRAYIRKYGPEYEIEVVAKEYRDEKALFLEAMSLNANHGRNMTAYDRTHAIQLASKLEIDPAQVATSLNMKVERVIEFKIERCSKIENTRTYIPLKMPIRHMAGKELTRAQADIVPKLGGNQQSFFVNQLILLIQQNLIDWENERLVDRLQLLARLIRQDVRIKVN